MANARVSWRGLLPDGALVGTFALDTIAARDKRFPAQSTGSPARPMRQRPFLRVPTNFLAIVKPHLLLPRCLVSFPKTRDISDGARCIGPCSKNMTMAPIETSASIKSNASLRTGPD
jgi:hypothetical protein